MRYIVEDALKHSSRIAICGIECRHISTGCHGERIEPGSVSGDCPVFAYIGIEGIFQICLC
jgi:hypothetical protein